MKPCNFNGCGNTAACRGLCHGHYQQLRMGRTLKPLLPKDPVERFWQKVDKSDGCWVWTGAVTSGYGCYSWRGRMRKAHRVAFELAAGDIPAGLQLDHLCRNTRCVRPDHLEPVTARVNVHRGVGPAARHHAQTHCKRGHEFTAENTIILSGGRGRNCRTCDREYKREWARRDRARKRAAT